METDQGRMNSPPITFKPSTPAFRQGISMARRVPFEQRYPLLLLLCLGVVFAWLPHAEAATDCTAVTEIPQVECEALVALYNSTDVPKSDSNYNWNVTNIACSWRGVTCSAGHVTELDLSWNEMSGPIPSELGNLSQLTKLDFSSSWWNRLSGPIPSELGNLSQLRELSLRYNQLSGPIPSELGNLSQLRELNLEYNQLSGPIPSELGNLSLLTELNLFDNQVSGPIPSELGNQSQLRELYLGNNQLSGPIPSELGNLSQLTGLYLWSNQLNGPIPSELGNLSQLTGLSLGGNQLSGPIPSELGNLSQLTTLYLRNNQLSGPIPSELGNLSQLKRLILDGNQLSGPIPSELGNLNQLEWLWLNNNQLSGPIPSELSGLNRLQELDLGHNHLTASDAGLISFLDIKVPDWALTQTLTIIKCASGNGSVAINPLTLDFGSEVVGDSISLTINTRSEGCGELQVDSIEFTGNDASEFVAKNKECYDGEWQDQTFSACRFTLVFSPTAAGSKDVSLNVVFSDPSVKAEPMPLLAKAVDMGQPTIEGLPDFYDFGTVTMGRGAFEPQTFILKNAGNVNLKFDIMALLGVDAFDFSLFGDCASQLFLRPSENCQFLAQFMPTLSTGEKQANVNLDFKGDFATALPLNGTVTEPADCSEENITIASSGDGFWGEPETWERHTDNAVMQDELGTSSTWANSKLPMPMDVVQIQNGHTIDAMPFATVKALCIEEDGMLVSLDNKGTALEIQADDYIQNKGTIRGKEGKSETADCLEQDAVGTGSCAYPGANVILKVGTHIKSHAKAGDLWWNAYASGGPFFNTGEIKAGNGGNGSHYAASGGDAIVLGRNTTNTGTIKAGQGGNLTGTGAGKAGRGGLTQIWGKLGGLGHLYNQHGAQALAGKGGDCNPSATAAQIGGRGGNLWLVSLPDVHLSGGQHEAGTGGKQCISSGGANGEDGSVTIEPNVIDLSGAGTSIKGGDVAIYGGKNWTLDLSNLSATVLTATGDITLAVGEGGVINMRGSTDTILQAGGQVQIFSDEIVLDEDVSLSNLIQATNIVVGPSKILREVSLTGPSKLLAEPEITLPVSLTLANNGPEADTYTLSKIDTAGWTLSQLPPSIEIKELDTVDLVLNVILPATLDETNVITVTATSQADTTVSATTDVQIVVGVPTVSGKIGMGSTVVSLPNPSIPICRSSSVINQMCNNRWQVLTDARLDKNASLTGGELAGTIKNQGFISQVTVQPDAVISGGKLSGYIKNEGTLVDFEFVGAKVTGGTLKGTIRNNSQVGGTFKDVQLAANTQIIGGSVEGEIIGDCEAPARLEKVSVKRDTVLSCVIIGNDVTFGEGVQFVDAKEHSETHDETKVELPILSDAVAVNAQGEMIKIDARFAGGISVNGGPFEVRTQTRLSEQVNIGGRISVDAAHVGQIIDILVVIAQPLSASETTQRYAMLDNHGELISWNGNMASLVTFQQVETEAQPIEVQIDNVPFVETGLWHFYLGYRLADGIVVYSPQSLDVNMTSK